jgi:PAS domain S-box-containing protein
VLERAKLVDRVALSSAWTALLVFTGYSVGAKIGFLLTFQPHPISTMWPPNAILLASLLLLPRKRWWVVLGAAFFAHLVSEIGAGVPLLMVLGWFVSNCSEALIGALCIEYFAGGRLRFDSFRHVLIFISCGVFFAPFVSSFLDAGFVVLIGWGTDNYWHLWRMRFPSNVLTALTLVPAIVMAGEVQLGELRKISFGRWVETVLLLVTVVTIGILAFAERGLPDGVIPLLVYAPLPFLIGAAVRFGPSGLSWASLITALLAVWGAIHGRGPFTTLNPSDSILTLQVFLIMMTVPLMILATVMEERRLRDNALRQSEERYKTVVESQTDMICRFLPDTTLTFVNDAYCRYFGRDRSELIGRRFADLVPEAGRDRLLDRIALLLGGPPNTTKEHEVVRPDGSAGWHQWTSNLISDGATAPIEFLGIGRDITERKAAEFALRESEERNRAILNALPDLVFLQDRDGVYLDYKAKDPGLLFAPPEEFLGKSMHEILPPALAQAAALCFDRAMQTRETQVHEYDIVLSGRRYWYEARIAPCNGTKFISVVRDITERKKAEAELRKSEERFAKAFNCNPQPMALTTLSDGLFIDVNESFMEMSGYTREELIGHTAIELGIYRDETEREVMLNRMFAVSGGRNIEKRFATKNGNIRLLLVSAEILPIGNEKCILTASTDITSHKKLEEELQLSEREFATLVENSPDIIARLDRDLRYNYVSRKLENVSGLGRSQFIGFKPSEIDIAGFNGVLLEVHCRTVLATGEISVMEYSFKDRSYRSRIIPEYAADGSIDSLMSISEDVTVQLRSEQELRELTARLFNLQDEERRRIARELHDGAAQNLFGITINLGNLQDRCGVEPETSRIVTECQTLAEQSLQELRTLSYLLHPPILDQAGLALALQWYVEGFTKRSGIFVDLISLEDIGRLASEVETALFRVVQESLTNIRRHSHSETATIRLEKSDREITLEIADNGVGMPGRDARGSSDRIADLGVGIPGMRQRLLQLGGRLQIESTENGTTIRAVVPLVENGAKC